MVFISAFVTNDNFANLLGAILTFVVLRYLKAPSYLRVAVIGVVLGLLFTTKLSTLSFGLVLVPVCLFAPDWTRRVWSFVLACCASLVVSGWYLIQNTVRYGDPLARHATASYLTSIGSVGSAHIGQGYEIGNPLHFLFGHVPLLFVDSFWYESGWNTFRWPLSVNVLFSVVAVLALLGLLRANIDGRVLISLGSLSIAALLSVWIVALQVGSSGRYALAGVSAMAALVSLGVQRCRIPVRFVLPAIGLCGTLVAIQTDVVGFHWT
jgi:hypothetical protein